MDQASSNDDESDDKYRQADAGASVTKNSRSKSTINVVPWQMEPLCSISEEENEAESDIFLLVRRARSSCPPSVSSSKASSVLGQSPQDVDRPKTPDLDASAPGHHSPNPRHSSPPHYQHSDTQLIGLSRTFHTITSRLLDPAPPSTKLLIPPLTPPRSSPPPALQSPPLLNTSSLASLLEPRTLRRLYRRTRSMLLDRPLRARLRHSAAVAHDTDELARLRLTDQALARRAYVLAAHEAAEEVARYLNQSVGVQAKVEELLAAWWLLKGAVVLERFVVWGRGAWLGRAGAVLGSLKALSVVGDDRLETLDRVNGVMSEVERVWKGVCREVTWLTGGDLRKEDRDMIVRKRLEGLEVFVFEAELMGDLEAMRKAVGDSLEAIQNLEQQLETVAADLEEVGLVLEECLLLARIESSL